VGAILGVLVGVADPLNPALRAFRPTFDPLNQIAFSLAVLLPALAMTGVAAGLLLRLARGVSRGLCRAIVWVFTVILAAALFVYTVLPTAIYDALHAQQAGDVKYIGTTTVAAAATFAALYGLALALLRRRSRRTASVLAVVLAVLWGGAAAWTYGNESRPTFPATVPQSLSDRPNVLLIVLDTVRADHLSCYGYDRKTTPNIDEFARTARVYTNAVSPSCWTLPAHASLFTGLPYSAHGTDHNHLNLDRKFETLSERLKAAGYQTAGFSANGFISSYTGLDRGFDLLCNFYPRRDRSIIPTLAESLVWHVLEPGEWLSRTPPLQRGVGEWFRDGYRAEKPFFMFLNYMDAHDSCVPTRRLQWTNAKVLRKWELQRNLELIPDYMFKGVETLSPKDLLELEALYDEKMAYLDRKVGRLLTFLRTSGLDRNMLIIITSDHGENLGDHHLTGHGYSVHETLVHVPLMVKWDARFQPGEDHHVVQTTDIFASVLEAAGVAWQKPAASNSESLLQAKSDKPRPCFSEYLTPALAGIADYSARYPTLDFGRFLHRLRAVRLGDMKLIRSSDGTFELYDLAKDPFESRNLAAANPQTVRDLQKVLDDWLQSFEHYKPAANTPEDVRVLSVEQLNDLRGLGYIK
jgi:arylsulfatase A-like enzyme